MPDGSSACNDKSDASWHSCSIANRLAKPELPSEFCSLRVRLTFRRIIWIVFLLSALTFARAQQKEVSVPLSQRMTINLSAGVPQSIGNAATDSNAPQSQWWYENSKTSPSYATPGFVENSDSSVNWQQVGLPYDANIKRTFINQASGGGQGSLTGNDNWYRLHFKIDSKYAAQKFLLNLEGTHTGVQVYINGTLLKGISQVAADAQATHVVGFVPVVVDLTPYLHADGVTDNVIAVDVSRASSWFEQPNFSGAFRFGQAMAGLFRNVFLVLTNAIHIPLNVYSNTRTWGTYVGTVSEVPAAQGTATAASAVVDVQTNVLNESAVTQQVTLTTQVVDALGDVVLTAPPLMQAVAPMTAATFPSTPAAMFEQKITIANPTLWYPNNSVYGKPYMYRVYHIVSVNGVVVDATVSPLGIRTITWDANFPYFNGHAQYLWGGSGRYDYPALGSSVPDEQQWRDLAQFAASGGNIWRPGHSTSSEEFVAAADAYGVMIDQPSGDGEGAFTNPSADDAQLKQELHRDMIIRDRSHPSILDWEMDNGGNNLALAQQLGALGQQWDNINPRQQASRAYSPQYAFIDECDGAGCEVGNKQQNPNNPAFGAEYWDNVGTGRGLAWDYELAFANGYLNDWRDGRANNTFGMAQWYFADTPGEVALYAEYQNNASMTNYVRSLGYSMVDQNRFPRLLYYIYQANWVPYSIKPVVALAHHWNRAYQYTAGTPLQENAFSNCPAVRLLINGVAKDPVTGAALADQTPNPWNIATNNSINQNVTTMPGQVHWMVNWAPGTVTAECIDASGNVVQGASDTRTTAGAENKIVLSVVPNVTRPDGTSFQWTSNGSDAAFIVAQVQDAQGNLVPTAADNVTFSVSGPATYMGGTQQLVADPAVSTYYQDAFSKANVNVVNGVPYAFFHSPGDPELNFEGGLQKIALRSTFAPGSVTVTASAPGLVSGSVQLASVAPAAPVQSQAPSIIVPPVDTSVSSGYPATFTVAASGSGTLLYQWYVNGAAISGATGTSYSTAATTAADNGKTVSVTISSNFGNVTSNAVKLTVSADANAAITLQPQSQNAVVGQAATFTIAASGSPQLSYQWFVNGAPVANGAQSTYVTPVLLSAGTSSVYVVVTNPLNQVQSATVALTVTAPIPVSFTAQPQGRIVPVNQPVQLSATVAGSAPFTYSWNFTPAGGASSILVSNTQTANIITYNVPAMSASTVGSYTLTVNNAANTAVTSAAAQLTLAPPGINLALNRVATASSTQNACTDQTTTPPLSGVNCLGAENAVDGNVNSRWASASAGQPPATVVAGVDPSWLQVDLGSVQGFNTVILNWENAYAAQYKIQYTNQDPATNPAWQDATKVILSSGGVETLNFPTVQARYVRMLGLQRATQYGYSLLEFQVYDVAQCGGSNERYTVNAHNAALVLDNLIGLTWTRTIQTDSAAGSQFTGVDAVNYCKSINMRVPTQSEALGISGSNNASCAFPGTWNTWTSTVDPQDASETALVNFDGTASYKVTKNWPGAVLCTSGNFVSQAPVISAQPQPTTVAVGQTAAFAVTATGSPAPTYQWLRNGAAIASATASTYVTTTLSSADNNAVFSVVVSNSTATVTSTHALLTVTAAPVAPTQPSSCSAGATDAAIPGFCNGPIPAGANLAFKKVASSSGDENSNVLPPSAAFDGDLTSRWSSAFADAEWLQVDLGSVQAIGQVVLRWERAYGTKYQILTSPDGVKFTPVYQQANGLGGTENITFNAVNARYVRLNGQARSSIYGYSLWEFEVYASALPTIVTQPVAQTVTAGAQAQFTVVAGGVAPFTYQWLLNGASVANANAATYTTPSLYGADNGGKYSVVVSNAAGSVTSSVAAVTVTSPVAGSTNLALYKTATSSGDENASLAPINAVDGSLTTRWSSAFSDTAWFQVDLGSSTQVSKVVLYWESAYGKAYQILASNDAQNWTPVYTQTAGTGGVETLNFSPVTARFLRMQGTTRATAYGYSLFEFQAFGANLPAIVSAPAAQTAAAGSKATFTVTAGSNGPFTYQWLRNGVVIAGATAATYTTPALKSADSGSTFAVQVTNASGTTTPAAVALTVTSSTPTTLNLALHKPATDSSSQDEASLGAAFAVDGDQTTRWASAAGVDPSWIAVDLGTTTTINQVVLRWEAAYGKAYQIQASSDSKSWTPVFTQSAGFGGVENLSFTPISARYVRMYGTTRGSQYGYSLYELEVYGSNPTAPSGTLSITKPPASQSATIGGTATFNVVAGGTGPFTYQWLRNGALITGATAASYTTSTLTAADSGAQFTVTVGNAAGTATVTSMPATLTVGSYTVYPGFLGVDLVNNTHGAWANNQVYVTVIGMDPANGQFAYVTPAGSVVDFTLNDASAANHLTAANGTGYGNYSFTLAQSTLLKLPLLTSARAYISLGAPLYVQVYADKNGKINGYAGPNPQNGSDPNFNTHFDWYEFNYGGTANANTVYINTTQVDQFGLPLLLDVWANAGSFHKQTGITESIAQLDQEFAKEVPLQFQPPAMSNLRIFSPAKMGLAAGAPYGNYFDATIAQAWASYQTKPLSITLSGRTYTGTASGASLTFQEANPSAAHAGERFVVQQPSTQDVLGCAGTMASGVAGSSAAQGDENAVQLQLENQICSAINRGVLSAPANWANAASYYASTPANFYSQFWHNHSVGGLAYGFSYDDNNNQSTTNTTQQPEHMTFTIGW